MRFVQPEKIEIDANERAVNEKSPYCFFVCTTFDSFLNDLLSPVATYPFFRLSEYHHHKLLYSASFINSLLYFPCLFYVFHTFS